MMKNKIRLNRQDIIEILNTLSKFPEVNDFCLEIENTGLGNVIELEFDLEVAGVRGIFNVEVTGVRNW